MQITKLGHCCLLIETKGKRILTDPGSFTIDAQTKLTDIDYILYTHEHQDHFHIESLKVILEKNPNIHIFSIDSVSKLLDEQGITHTQVNNGQNILLGEVKVSGIGEKHAQMHSSIPLSANMGYMIDERLWYPGDSFTNPMQAVEILALPVSGPWMKLSDAIDCALTIKPKIAFPVHDAIRFGSAHTLTNKILSENGIEFVAMVEGDKREF
jgi:L-ascorbate metabolism protein UlaG (beta-lactamase superfamily)